METELKFLKRIHGYSLEDLQEEISKRIKLLSGDDVIYFDDDEVNEAFICYMAWFRKRKRKKMSPEMIKGRLDILRPLSNEQIIEVLKINITNDNQGLFLPKHIKPKQNAVDEKRNLAAQIDKNISLFERDS